MNITNKSNCFNLKYLFLVGTLCLFQYLCIGQDSTKSLLDVNNNKIVKKINSILDSNQKKINNLINSKIDKTKNTLNKGAAQVLSKTGFTEIEKPLPYERLKDKKYTLGRRAYQNTVSQFNYLFNATEELNEIITKARILNEDDFTELISFYDYELFNTSKSSIDSIVYRCNANIVLHDLRSNYVDDAYLLMAKAYFLHKDFDTAGSILQFINYSFDEKEDGADLPIGSNLRNTNGRFSIATKEENRIWENKNVRNESMIWQARNYFEAGELNEGMSLLQILETDALFPKRLHPFLNEQIAYGNFQLGNFENAANYLVKALPNAIDVQAKARWTYLIGQLYEKVDKTNWAYTWFKKASQNAVNPIINIYATINLIRIDAKKDNQDWLKLTHTLEKMAKKDKFLVYADIIYYELAKIAIDNKDYSKANEWLIVSIKKNKTNARIKQKAFEKLADINYLNDQYTLSKLAYDALNAVVKTNSLFETIQNRKKWIGTIETNDQIMKTEDTLQFLYQLPKNEQATRAIVWQKNINKKETTYANLFVDDSQKATPIKNDNLSSNTNFNNTGFNTSNFSNTSNFNNLNSNFNSSSSNNNNNRSDFYFDNPQTIAQGKENFIRKWGARPNVDQWRRKTSNTVSFNNREVKSNLLEMQAIPNKDSLAIPKKENKNTVVEKIEFTLLNDSTDFIASEKKWNKACMANAQIFLITLNDFNKALPLYEKIITKNLEPTITERALLDLASHYLHNNQQEKSDSLIQRVQRQFPNGIYETKKKEDQLKKSKELAIIDDYNEAYFLSQIGNWDSLMSKTKQLEKDLNRTRWATPFQFLKVKMYAQLGMDSIALGILDLIVANNNNERIRDRAKNIATEIKNRKSTEAYLNALKIDKTPIQKTNTINTTDSIQESPTLKAMVKEEKKESIQKEPINAERIEELPIQFTNDSTEPHYIAFLTNNINEVFVKEMQTAFKYLHSEEFEKQNLNVTYVQFEERSYILWIGPFENQLLGTNYINKIKTRLTKELISFVKPTQYEIFIIAKSNILLIKNSKDFEQYKRNKLNYFFKP